ncbi:MAG: DUF547 domain-containing protein [Solirubrobacterales bacterium]
MARARILNPAPAPTELGAVALSREILAEAKAVEAPGRCARLDDLAGQLHGVAPERIEGDAARIAFWANLYNALMLHCLCLRPLRGNLLWHLRLFDRIAYRVGPHDYPLNLIENGLLRANRRAPFRLRRPLRRSDPRRGAAPSQIDPRIHFALNCGARSCPPIRDYDPDSLDAQLELATRSYLDAETQLDPRRGRVRLPRLMRIYGADFGDRDGQLRFAARYVPQLADWLGDGSKPMRVAYGHFDWTVAPAPSAQRRILPAALTRRRSPGR